MSELAPNRAVKSVAVSDDAIDEASRDSFPASDAPAWTPVTGAVAGDVTIADGSAEFTHDDEPSQVPVLEAARRR